MGIWARGGNMIMLLARKKKIQKILINFEEAKLKFIILIIGNYI